MKKFSSLKCILAWLLTVGIMICLFSAMVGAAEKSSSDMNRYNIVIVLDASGSMKDTDPNGLRYDAISLFTGLISEEGHHLGGVVFSDHVSATEALSYVDSSNEKDKVIDALGAVKVGGNTNIGEGLNTAVNMIEKDGDKTLPSAIILLTDGNTVMGGKNDSDVEKNMAESLALKADAFQKARDNGIKIFSVCLNVDDSADISEMEQLATATNGHFVEVKTAEDLNNISFVFNELLSGSKPINFDNGEQVVIGADGVAQKTFVVPGFGVEEVNVVVHGNADEVQLKTPSGTDAQTKTSQYGNTMLTKVTDVVPGEWTLTVHGVPEEKVELSLLYNTNLSIRVSQSPKTGAINPSDTFSVYATLRAGDKKAKDENDLQGFEASLDIKDKTGNIVKTINMESKGKYFVAEHQFANEGIYTYTVKVSAEFFEKTTDPMGPLTVSSKANNTAPVAKKDVIKKTVFFWPFSGGTSVSLNLNDFASDSQDEKLDFQIISSSFVEGKDFVLDENNIINMQHFSIPKGEYSVRAIDSGGMYCDFDIIVKSHNIGLIALIGVLLAVLLLAGLTIHKLRKPFYTNGITVQTSNGTSETRKKSKGRLRLSAFGVNFNAINPRKCYFQATGDTFIYFISNKPVYVDGNNKTKKVKIQSNKKISLDQNGNEYFTVQHTSSKVGGNFGHKKGFSFSSGSFKGKRRGKRSGGNTSGGGLF